MIEELSIEDTLDYTIEQMFDSSENLDLIAAFEASEKGKGLEYYLKEAAEPPKQEKFVQRHVKPKYDEGCVFMYQVL